MFKNKKQERKQFKSKGFFMVLFLLILGASVGASVGHQLDSVPVLGYVLNIGKTFGQSEPVNLDLGLIFTTIKVNFKLTISSVLGVITTLNVMKLV